MTSHLELLQKKQNYWQKSANLRSFEGLGDLHEHIYKIKSGNKIFYENCLGIETFLTNLTYLLPWTKEFIPHFSIAGDFITRNYIPAQESIVNPTEYYQNFGKVLAFCLYFRVIDIHMENVLTTASSPLLFDIEFMLTPNVSYFPFDIKMTGLLSGQTKDNNTALLGGLYDIRSYLKPVLNDTDAHAPKIEWIVKCKGTWSNLPPEKTHPYLFIDAILQGFNKTTTDLIEKTPRIAALLESANFKTRILARTTRLYRFINLSYTFPQVKTKYPKTYFHNKLIQTHTSGFFKPNRHALIEFECDQLCKCAIPYFTLGIHSKDVTDTNGIRVGTVAESPYKNWTFHAKMFPTFASHQGKQIVRILKNNYAKYKTINQTP